MPKKPILREKDIDKLSIVTKCPADILYKLKALHLIDKSEAQDILILADWRKLRNDKLKTAQVFKALAANYRVSKTKIESVVYAKKRLQYWCGECEKRIPKGEYVKNNGICNKCIN